MGTSGTTVGAAAICYRPVKTNARGCIAMFGGLPTRELSAGDEGQQDEHEERARWNENKLRGFHRVWNTNWHNNWDTWDPEQVCCVGCGSTVACVGEYIRQTDDR